MSSFDKASPLGLIDRAVLFCSIGEIRTLNIDGEPWFVGKDIASKLGYTDTFGALKKHVDGEDKQNCQNDSFETPRGLTIINESGVYSLILSSKLPSAKKSSRGG